MFPSESQDFPDPELTAQLAYIDLDVNDKEKGLFYRMQSPMVIDGGLKSNTRVMNDLHLLNLKPLKHT